MDIMTPEEWNNENYPYPNCRSILHNGREMEKRMKEYSDYVLRESQNSSTSDEALPIADVGRSVAVEIEDRDIATIEALHDLLLDAHGYSLDFITLKRARELTAKMYKAFD